MFDVRKLVDLSAEIIYFPVRHHSPACARYVVQLIEQVQPAAVLVEGPSDYNAQIGELFYDHQLPIAIYTYANLQDGTRSGAFYPFCTYSPEWQALTAGREIGANVQFIDLPWTAMARQTLQSHRYANGDLHQSSYIPTVCAELGVDSLDDAWDTLAEIDPDLTLTQFMERIHLFGYHARMLDVVDDGIRDKREHFMARQIIAMQNQVVGKIVVVTGAFHSFALSQLVDGVIPLSADDSAVKQLEGGIALTPYSYERLDNLTGYEAGMPSPGFYDMVWQSHVAGEPFSHHPLLGNVAQRLRDRKQIASAADLIAVETTAQALASLRGHARVWRRDIVDGIIAGLLKEELADGVPHPFLAAVYDEFRGSKIGRLDAKTTLPPLVYDIDAELEKHKLTPQRATATYQFELTDPTQLAQSRVLHRMRLLGMPGFELRSSRASHNNDWARESWRTIWLPEQQAAKVEAAIYGASLREAAQAKLLENAAKAEHLSAETATSLLTDAAFINIQDIDDQFVAALSHAVEQDSNFFSLAPALNQLLFLYRFDEVLGTMKSADIGTLLSVTFQRSLWQLESLGAVNGNDGPLLDGVRAVLQTFERCDDLLTLNPTDFVDVFERISAETSQTPLLRGAAHGVLWALGQAKSADVTQSLQGFAQPELLGDFLGGVFYLARETAQRDPALMQGIDNLLTAYSDEEYLISLPALRLAFSYFTPREKHFIAGNLFDEISEQVEPDAILELAVDAETAARVYAYEVGLFKQLAHYGLLEKADE